MVERNQQPNKTDEKVEMDRLLGMEKDVPCNEKNSSPRCRNFLDVVLFTNHYSVCNINL